MRKHTKNRPPARIVILLRGSEVMHVASDGAAVDCLTVQIDSGEYDAVGRPVLGLQRGMADVDAAIVDPAFRMSDQIPILPHDEEYGERTFRESMTAFRVGRNRNN